MDKKQIQDAQIRQAMANNMTGLGQRVKDDDIVVCPKCECEFFINGIRLAKSTVNFKPVVGLIHENPHLFCFACGERLSDDASKHITKKELLKKKGKNNEQPKQ